MHDNSWIQAPLSGELVSWPPQKQGLAREIHDLRVMNKDQGRELARALERPHQLEVDLQASNRAHSDFQSLAERGRFELEQAYLGAMDRAVTVANPVLDQESQLQLTRPVRSWSIGLLESQHRRRRLCPTWQPLLTKG